MNQSDDLPVLCLMGPTGAGKTACALALAEHVSAEIISVDSALIYRGMDIGTAKPTPVQLRQVAHHLIDICDPSESYSAAGFRADALRAVDDIRARGKLPILVGGTGLYFSALLRGLAPLPTASPALREQLQQRAAADGIAAMHAYLAQVDPPSAARIHPHDPQRILRALEIYELSGRSMSEHLKAETPAPLPYRVIRWVLAPADREAMHQTLARRFYLMLERGLINEVTALRGRGDLDLTKPAMRAVGYRAVWRYLEGELNYAAMVDAAIVATRQLAKRQFTWFRRESDAQWWDSATQDLPMKMLAALDKPTTFAGIVDYTEHATR